MYISLNFPDTPGKQNCPENITFNYMYVCMCSTYVNVHIRTHYMYVCIYIFLKKREIEQFGV